MRQVPRQIRSRASAGEPSESHRRGADKMREMLEARREVLGCGLGPGPAADQQQRLKLFVLLFGCVAISLIVLLGSHVSALSRDPAVAQASAMYGLIEAQEQGRDFSKFSHTDTHAALPCLLCHRREDNATRPALPGHQSCAGCHTQRFNDSANPICSVCHTNAQAGAVKPFPSLRSFNMR